MHIAKRMFLLGDETAFEMLKKARKLEQQGREIIHFEIGEPGTETPREICEAGKSAIDRGFTHYEPTAGRLDLREAIAEDSYRFRGVPVNPEQVVVTPGAKPIMFFSMLACIDPGSEVLYPDPGFPIYPSVIRFAGAEPVPVPLREENEFRMDIDEVKSLLTDRTKMIILNFPENPTGSLLNKDDLIALSELAVKHDLIILSDEVYKEILYDGEYTSIISLPGMAERTIILDGFSKAFSMTGWRLGYGIMPDVLAEHIARLMVNSNSCVASFSQIAALEALKGSREVPKKITESLRKKRDLLADGLNNIEGIHCQKPPGAFYIFLNISELGHTSNEVEEFLLNDAGVATLAGSSFGEFGEGYIRFAYSTSTEDIHKALELIRLKLPELLKKNH